MRSFSFREKVLVGLLGLIIIGVSLYWGRSLYFFVTHEVPDYGGAYVEALVGQPAYVNPIFSGAGDADADIVSLVYAGLFRYDENGQIKPYLAKSSNVSEDGKVYTVKLRDDILWHDGENVSADDALFTYKIIQDPAYKSIVRKNWAGVQMEAKEGDTIEFRLNSPDYSFLQNLTVGILPKHLWENVAPESFSLAALNLEPVGCGPYKFSKLQKDASGRVLSYSLDAFHDFVFEEPYLSKITFQFYPEDPTGEMYRNAYETKFIQGISQTSFEQANEWKNQKDISLHDLQIPHYYLVYFNQNKSVPLAYDEVREALSLSVNRHVVIDEAIGGHGEAVSFSFLPGTQGFVGADALSQESIEKAKKLLEDKGWALGEDGIRKKNDIRLSFTLVTAESPLPGLTQTAELLQEQWRTIGVEMNIDTYAINDLVQDVIKERKFEALLYAQAMNIDPNLYAYWHSSQKDGGFNLSGFKSDEADKVLEKLKEEDEMDERKKLFEEFKRIFFDENPAIYLFTTDYIYPASNKVKGMEAKNIVSPSGRFTHVEKWYIKTDREMKQWDEIKKSFAEMF